MATAELQILITARDQATKTLQQMNQAIENSSKQLRQAGMVAVGAGAAIVGALAMAAKGASDEQAGIERLRGSMANVGLSYDTASVSLEGWIKKQMQSTSYADDEQRSALAQLVSVTKDLTGAQGLLTTAMDFARGKGIDLATATDVVTKVFAGNVGTLSRYGVVVRDGATATEALGIMQQQTAGQAARFGQTVSGQMAILKNNFDDLKETIGAQLLPTIQAVIRPISEFVARLSETNPELLKLFTQAGLATGAIALLGGGLLLTAGYLPKLVTGYQSLILVMNAAKIGAISLNAAIGPIGWIAIAGAAVGITALLAGQFHQTQLAVDGLGDSISLTGRRVQLALGGFDAFGFATDAAKERMQAWKSAVDDMNRALDANAPKQEDMKVALASATYMLAGVTYRTSLFTEAEIKLATASGKKVERLKQQNDTVSMSSAIIDGALASLAGFTKQEQAAAEQATVTQQSLSDLLAAYASIPGFGSSPAYMNAATSAVLNQQGGSGNNLDEIMKNYLDQWRRDNGLDVITPTAPAPVPVEPPGNWWPDMPSYAVGGKVRETGLAYMHRGETVLPANTPIVVEAHMQLDIDGERIADKIFRIGSKQARLRGYGTNG